MTTIFKKQSELASAVKAESQSRNARAFSFSRLFSSMTVEGTPLDGYEREVVDEITRAAGGYFDCMRMPIPVQLLSDPTVRPDVLARDLSAGISAAGGYLVGAQTAPVADLLRPWSVTASAGVTLLPVPTGKLGAGSLIIPKTAGAMTAYWISGEATPITPSYPTIGTLKLDIKSGAVYTKYSHLLARQGNVADALLQREMLKTIGRLLDNAVINGTGSGGQPTGILNTTGVNSDSVAATFDGAKACLLEASAANQGGDDSAIGFVANADVRKLLKTRLAFTGGSQLWQHTGGAGSMMGRSAYVSIDAPASTVICGPWSDLALAMWGMPYLEINRNDPAGFKAGTVEARIFIDCDVGLLHPGAWSKVSNLT